MDAVSTRIFFTDMGLGYLNIFNVNHWVASKADHSKLIFSTKSLKVTPQDQPPQKQIPRRARACGMRAQSDEYPEALGIGETQHPLSAS
ncbi:hypothetical protein TNCV_5034691 [Trichonephila clavipes]|nr:hypothetical protein TNCV_5034691 [Trichonephila clavipes]